MAPSTKAPKRAAKKKPVRKTAKKKTAKRKTAKKAAPKSPGRPRKRLDTKDNLEKIEMLASLWCTYDEIASALGVTKRTFIRRVHEEQDPPVLDEAGEPIDNPIKQAYERGWDRGKMSLRRTQVEMSKKNVAMAIFLGKQYLGQKDVISNEHTGPITVVLDKDDAAL